MAKKQQIISNGSVEQKGAPASKVYTYASFGWVRAKGPVPAGTKVKGKEQAVLLKRRAAYGQDGILRNYEDEYLKREKKRYRQLPILGIITFFLMLAFLAIAGVELYFGISQGLDRINYEGTYNFYNEDGEKVDYPLFELTKDTWAYKTSNAETPEKSGTIKNKVTSLDFCEEVAEDSEEEPAVLFTVIMSRGTLKIFDTTTAEMKGQTYFSEKSKLSEKYSVAKVAEEEEEAESAPYNADEEEEEEDEEGEEEAAPASSGGITAILDKVRTILNKYHDEYVTKVTGFLDGKATEATTDEEGEVVPGKVADGFISGLAEKVGAPIGAFISGDTVVALVALILFIMMACFFSAIAKKKKKRRMNEARKSQLLSLARQRVDDLQRSNPALMNKMQRKAYMWESILTNALRNVGIGGSGDSAPISDDEEFDFD